MRSPRPRGPERPAPSARGGGRQAGGDTTVVLAYPNTFAVAMSSLGYQIVRRGFETIPGVLCLRAFMPGAGPRRGALLTHDSPREVRKADWLAFSVSYENDYPNMLAMTAASGIPLAPAQRAEADPLVVVGGIAPSLNPEPLAGFADLFVIGEAEEAVPELMAAWRKARDEGLGREETLHRLAGVDGVYVPRFYRPSYLPDGTLEAFTPLEGAPSKVRRLWIAGLDRYRADSDVASPEAEFRDMILVEMGRGCGRGCRFCAAGFFYRPVRYRGYETLRETIGSRLGGGERFGLLGASVFDHPDLGRVSEYLSEQGCSFSVSSARADALRDDVLERMAAGGLRTLTIAPETGTERLRRAIGKPIPDEALFEAARRVTAAGIPNLKLYFMVGLPGEEPRDVEGIVGLVKGLRHHVLQEARGKGAMGRIVVSLSCFVPKAWTPFQWHPMEEVASLKAKLRRLVKALGSVPNVSATHDVPRWAYVQALLARGDRRTGGALLAAQASGDWKAALRDSPVNPDFYVRRARGRDELFPWDFVDAGVEKGYLWREYRAATAGA